MRKEMTDITSHPCWLECRPRADAAARGSWGRPRRGIEFSEAHQTIVAIAADGEDAALLEIRRRAPILEVRRRGLDPSGRALEWSHDRYRGDAIEITIHNQDALPRSGVALHAAAQNRVSAGG
jgi:hypothetical protein